MHIILTKTDYILWRECKKNAWLKIHKPDIYNAQPLSDFERQIIETGNEVEEIARQLFPSGILIKDRKEAGRQETQKLVTSLVDGGGGPPPGGGAPPPPFSLPLFL